MIRRLVDTIKGMRWPGFKILDGYITRKFLGTYIFAIGLIIVIVVVFDAVEKIDDFIETKASLYSIIFRYYLNFIPFFVNQYSGLFTFIAVIFFTSKLAYQTEIVAMLSGGMSFRRLMWPYFVSATFIALLSLMLNFYVIPKANDRRQQFENMHLKKNRRVQYDKHIYRQLDPGVYLYVRDYTPVTQKASFLAIEQYEGHDIVGMLEAPEVIFNPKTRRWSGAQYVTRRFDGENEVYQKHERLDTLLNLSGTEIGKPERIIITMNMPELTRFIKEQREKGSDMIDIFEVERAQRISYPVSVFILTLIGVSLSSRKVRGGTGLHIGIGIALCFSYILIAKFAEEFAKGGVMPPVLAVWLPNIFYSFIALYLYKKAPK